MTDSRQHAPAAQRNRDIIRDTLTPLWPKAGTVLEIASGSGEHIIHFAAATPHLTFQPSDPSPQARASIDAWQADSSLNNVKPALDIDVTAGISLSLSAEMMFCANMIHITPWAATIGLLDVAANTLTPGGTLWLYGPFVRDDVETAESNLAFDSWLKGEDPRFGIRALHDVYEAAIQVGLTGPVLIEMPANNCLIGLSAPR